MRQLLLALLLPAIFFVSIDHTPGQLVDQSGGRIEPLLLSELNRKNPDETISLLILSEEFLTNSMVFHLEHFGKVESVIGRVATMRTTSRMVQELEKLNFIARLEASRPQHLDLDVSVPELSAPKAWTELKDQRGQPVDGSNVVIGIVDTGVDFAHRDFWFPNGSSKILYLWDQTISGKNPPYFSYGNECQRSDIETGRCSEQDTFGHGTHVAGIAASSGLASGRFRGVAPGAWVIAVKGGRSECGGENWSFSSSDILNGINYVWLRSRSEGKRAVVNLSLGGSLGGHDDTSAYEIALNELAARGLVVAVAAGNSAEHQRHVSGFLSRGASVTVSWELQTQTAGRPAAAKELAIDIWYSHEDSFDIIVNLPTGETVRGDTGRRGVLTRSGNVTVQAGSTSKGREWFVGIESSLNLTDRGYFLTLIGRMVTGAGGWDAWIVSDSCDFPAERFAAGNGYQVDMEKTINVPGTASGVITVASYITKVEWTNKAGGRISRLTGAVGDVSSFSSLGPTRDGRIKPDIAAPGEWIASARTSSAGAFLPRILDGIAPDTTHMILRGTSMSAPHVAGVMALIMQLNPQVSADQVKDWLREAARQDRFARIINTERGSTTWGWGKVDARTVLDSYRVIVAVVGVSSGTQLQVTVDGVIQTQANSAQQVEFVFRRGTVHTISVPQTVELRADTRLHSMNFVREVNRGGLYFFNYTAQYLLKVNSPYSAQGQGWYDSGTRAMFSAPLEVSTSGILGLLGAKDTLLQWLDEKGNILSAPEILMDGAHTVTAIYRTELLTLLVIVAVVTVASAGAGLLIVARRRRTTFSSLELRSPQP